MNVKVKTKRVMLYSVHLTALKERTLGIAQFRFTAWECYCLHTRYPTVSKKWRTKGRDSWQDQNKDKNKEKDSHNWWHVACVYDAAVNNDSDDSYDETESDGTDDADVVEMMVIVMVADANVDRLNVTITSAFIDWSSTPAMRTSDQCIWLDQIKQAVEAN